MLTLSTIRYRGSIQVFSRNLALRLLLEKSAGADNYTAQSPEPLDNWPAAIYPNLGGLSPERE
jgi:hypothetical protein